MENSIKTNMNLTKQDALDRFKSLLVVQSASTNEKKMRRFIRKRLTLIDPTAIIKMDTHGNIFFVKGKADVYPTVVSHMDTVHEMVDNARVIEYEEKLYCYNTANGKQIGTGGDDKVGIFIALELALELPVIKCVFFSREEIGCKGSGAVDMSFFDDSCFLLQADRKGDKDLVRNAVGNELFGDEFSKELLPIARKYGYKETMGGSTDVVELKKRGIPISVFNASCGYHSPHTSKEWCDIAQVFNTLDFFRDICNTLNTKRWEHVYVKPATVTYSSSNVHRHSNSNYVTNQSNPPWNGASKPDMTTSDVNMFSWGRGLHTNVEDVMDDWRVMLEFFPIEIEDIVEKDLPFVC